MGYNFQLLMLSPNLLKSQIPFMVGWGRGPGWAGIQLSTFDAESQSAKISNSFYGGGGGGGGSRGGKLVTNFQKSTSNFQT